MTCYNPFHMRNGMLDGRSRHGTLSCVISVPLSFAPCCFVAWERISGHSAPSAAAPGRSRAEAGMVSLSSARLTASAAGCGRWHRGHHDQASHRQRGSAGPARGAIRPETLRRGHCHAAASNPFRHAVAAPWHDSLAAGAASALHCRALRSHRQVSPSHERHLCRAFIMSWHIS